MSRSDWLEMMGWSIFIFFFVLILDGVWPSDNHVIHAVVAPVWASVGFLAGRLK
jgi:hypothetical protein